MLGSNPVPGALPLRSAAKVRAVAAAHVEVGVADTADVVLATLNWGRAHRAKLDQWCLGKLGGLDEQSAGSAMPARAAIQKCLAFAALRGDGVAFVAGGALDDQYLAVKLPGARLEVEGCAVDRADPCLMLGSFKASGGEGGGGLFGLMYYGFPRNESLLTPSWPAEINHHG